MTAGRKIQIIIFILMPLLLVEIFSLVQTRNSLIKRVYDQRQKQAALSGRVLDEKFDHLFDLGLSLSTRPVFRKLLEEGDWGAAMELMKDVPANFPFINRIILADTLGTIKADFPAIKSVVNGNQSQYDWYKGVSSQWTPYLSEAYSRPDATKTVVVALALPVRGIAGAVSGIILLQVTVRELLGWDKAAGLGESGLLSVVDQKGHLVLAPNAMAQDSIADYSSFPAVQKIMSGQSGVEIFYNPVSKKQVLTAYEQVPKYNWGVMVQQNVNEALNINTTLGPILLFYILVILLALLFTGIVVAEVDRRKKSEKEIRKYLELLNDTHVLQRNMEDEIVFWNRGMENLYGWTQQEAIGRVSHEIFQTEFPKERSQIEKELMQTGEWQGELKHQTKNGSTIYVSSHWYLHRDRHGNPDAIVETNNDITELKIAEEKLRKSEQSIHLLIDNVKDYAIFLLDKEGRVASWNSGAAHIKGYHESEIIGKSFEIFYTAEDIDQGVPTNNLKMATQFGHYESEGWRVRKDGTLFYANVVFTALFDNSGQLYGFSKITRNITEGRMARQQLEMLSRQIEQANDAICTLDDSLKIVSWNRGAEKLYGFTKEEAIGKDANKLLKTGVSSEQITAALSTIADKDHWGGDVTRENKAGEKVFVHASSSAIRDEAGKIVGFVAVSFDITEQKKLQEKIFHLANIVEQTTEAIISLKLDRTFISWNQGAANLFGYSSQEALGRNGTELGIVRLTSEETSEIISQLKVHGAWRSEVNFYNRKGRAFCCSVSANLVRNDLGEAESIVLFIRDISVRKQLEEDLRKSNEEMEAFTYSVSHDLRAPLRGIIGFTNILEEDYSSKLDAEARRITSIIKSNVSRMGQLIDDLLAFSRMGKQAIVKTATDTNEMLKEILSGMSFPANSPKIAWTIQSLPIVKADPNTLRQVWVNLISNAVKYSQKNPSPHIEIGWHDEDNDFVFYVRDNGVGFDDRFRSKLFKVFQRLHSQAEFEGTGIGLAIVERIVSRHGGRVWAEGKQDQGAQFYFSLPKDPEPS